MCQLFLVRLHLGHQCIGFDEAILECAQSVADGANFVKMLVKCHFYAVVPSGQLLQYCDSSLQWATYGPRHRITNGANHDDACKRAGEKEDCNLTYRGLHLGHIDLCNHTPTDTHDIERSVR